VSISSKRYPALPTLTLFQIVLQAKVAHPTPSILNHHHTQRLKKKRSDRMHGDGITQGGRVEEVHMDDMRQCPKAVEGGMNCAIII